MFEYEEEWFARWYPRCMPITRIAQTVLLRTRKILREKGDEQWQSHAY